MKTVTCILLSLGCLASAGCESRDYDLAVVEGTVKFDGKPLAGGIVNFQPTGGSLEEPPGPGSTARCDEQGRYQLETIHGDAGAVVGEHQVRIYSFSPETDITSDEGDDEHQEQIPQRYNYETELTFRVTSAGARDANFELSSH